MNRQGVFLECRQINIYVSIYSYGADRDVKRARRNQSFISPYSTTSHSSYTYTAPLSSNGMATERMLQEAKKNIFKKLLKIKRDRISTQEK